MNAERQQIYYFRKRSLWVCSCSLHMKNEEFYSYLNTIFIALYDAHTDHEASVEVMTRAQPRIGQESLDHSLLINN